MYYGKSRISNHKLQRDQVESLNFLCPSVDSSVGLCPAMDASMNEDGEEKATIFTPSPTLSLVSCSMRPSVAEFL